MADLGRITGPMLKANLERLGVDLVFENQLGDNNLFLEVNSQRIGINTSNVSRELTVDGTTQSSLIIVDNDAQLTNLYLDGDTGTITNYDGDVTINASGTLFADILETPSLIFNDNYIQGVISNENIELNPNGTGKVILDSDAIVAGNIDGGDSLTIQGNVTFGDDSNTDILVINAEIIGDLIPTVTDTFNVGTATKKWDELHSQFVNGEFLVTEDLSGIANINENAALRPGNSYYVSTLGVDSGIWNDGTHQLSGFRTIKHALSFATAGDTVNIYPGVYQEEFPLVVPAGVSVIGKGIRAVIVEPDSSSEFKDCFLLNAGTTVSNLTVRDFFYDSTVNEGYAFRFAPGYDASDRSPYIQNVSVITKEVIGTLTPGQITPGPAPTLSSYTSDSVALDKSFYSQALVDSLVGQTAVIDRYPNPPLFYTVVSIATEPANTNLWRMTVDTTFNIAGQLKPISFYPDVETTFIIANDNFDTTGSSIGEPWVAYFKTGLPPWFATVVGAGWSINVAGVVYVIDYVIEDPINTDQWRIYVTTSLVASSGIPIFSSPTGSAAMPAGRGALVDGDATNPAISPFFIGGEGGGPPGGGGSSGSITASMLFHSVTFIVPNSIGLYMTNGVRVEWLNSFTYFASKGLYATNGESGRLSPDGSSILYGAELRSIGSANVYGQVGAEGDGSDVLMYLINHNFAYIGLGTTASNDPTLVNQENETVTVNAARIYWQSDDQSGNFRVGEAFFVDQDTGLVTFNGIGQSVSGINEIVFSTGADITVLNAEKIETGKVVFRDNLISTTTGDLNIKSAVTPQTLQTSNIAGNLELTGNLSIDGTINIGNLGAIDVVTFASEIDSDIIPKISDTSRLGIPTLTWKSVWLGQASISDIVINDNKISTTTSNSDLELYAAGTGKIVFENLQVNTGYTANNVLNLKNTTIVGNFNQTGNQNISGNIDVTGDYQLSNNLSLAIPSLSFGDISVDSNVISTVTSNSNLDLLANGTGNIYIPINDVQLDQDLIYNTIQSSNIQVDDIISDIFNAGVLIQGNVITTPTLDLIVNAAGSGKVISDTILVDQNLTVNGISTLRSTSLESTAILGSVELTGNSQLTGDLAISNDLRVNYLALNDIAILGNVVTTTLGNNALLLQAGGTGKVVFDNTVNVDYNTLVQNTAAVNLANIEYQITSAQLILSGVTITSGVIESNNLNENLILDPQGIVNIPNSDVNINFDIDVLGTSTFGGLYNISTVNHTGNRVFNGNAIVNGTTEIYQSLSVGSYAQYQNLRIDDNTLSSNANIELAAPISKTVNINSNLLINNGLTIQGDLYSDDLTVNTQVQGLSIFVDSVLVQENFITTTISNADLELRANGIGVVRTANNVEITNDVNINGNTTLLDTSVSNLGLIGQLNQTGTVNQTGNLSVIGDVLLDTFTNGDVTISGNTITTTDSDSDLELLASGGVGNIVIPNANVVIENDLTVNDAYIAVQNITFPNDVSSDIYETDQLRFQNNFIEATVSNVDIELAAHGTGRVVVEPTLEINTGTFSLTGNSTFTNTTVTGTLGLTGTKQHIGTSNISGEYNLTGNLISSGQVGFEDYDFIDFRIATTQSNSDIDLRSAGGQIVLNDGVLFGQNLLVSNTTTVRNITGTTILTDQLFDGDIRIKDNFIETTLSNSSLNLVGPGTGGVRIERTQINNNILSTVDTNANLTILPYTGRFVDFDKTNAVKLPTGTTADKLTGSTGELRFNTSINRFEGWTNTGPITYGGIFSRNRATSVRALDTNVLDFTVNNTSRMTVDSTGVNLQSLLAGSLLFSGNTISSISNSDINLTPGGINGDIVYSIDSSGQMLSAPATARTLRGIFFKPDGTVAFSYNSRNVVSYPLSTPWDISSIGDHTTFSIQDLNAITAGGMGTLNNIGPYFKYDGTKFWVMGNGGGFLNFNVFVFEYSLSTPWDITTASHINKVNIGIIALSQPWFNADGTKFYEINRNTAVSQVSFQVYTCATAWTIVGMTGPTTYTFSLPTGYYAKGQAFNDDGTAFWAIISNGSNTFIRNYTLGTAWDVTTMTFVIDYPSSLSYTEGIYQRASSTDLYLHTSNTISKFIPDTLNVVMGDILFTGTTLTNTSPSANMIIQNTAAGYVKFNSSTALVLPTGDNDARPLAPEVGDLRFNTDLSAPEVFNGIAYSTLAGTSSNATLTEIQELNEIFAILLG